MNTIHTHALKGCQSTPLAHYLKALAVLRLVSEQADTKARGWWENDHFWLRTKLSKEELRTFFLEEYRPTPIIAPWNGGSGFSPKDNTTAINQIIQGESHRHRVYRESISRAVALRERLGITEKVDSSDTKAQLLTACRAELPEVALDWFDAAIVLLEDGPQYPPILGTGGNDGRLDFTNNFMQRLNDVVDPGTGAPTREAEQWLDGALFSDSVEGLSRSNIGQFFPSAAGGANSSTGFDGNSLINPWDFVLMLEGAMLFASASSRRLENRRKGAMSAPFTVRASGVGYGSSSTSDSGQSRGELWLPLWSEPASHRELRALFSEGRASVGRQAARNGIDFARAVATLGVDRGIDAFERIGLHERNGLAYFAVPLGRLRVERRPQVDLLNEIDAWMDRFSSAANGKNAPGRVASASRQLDEAVFSLSRSKSADTFLGLFLALGRAERALAASHAWTREQFGLPPLQLTNWSWVEWSYDGTAEFRLAAALASIHGHKSGIEQHIREHTEPVQRRGSKWGWAETVSRDVVWSHTRLVDGMLNTLKRRLMLSNQTKLAYWSDSSIVPARLDDIAQFIEGRVDEQRLNELFSALLLMKTIPYRVLRNIGPDESKYRPDAVYGLMKLCFAGHRVNEVEVPIHNAIVHRALAGSAQALELAVQRLRASGLPPAVTAVYASESVLTRATAALLFPISQGSIHQLVTANLRSELADAS